MGCDIHMFAEKKVNGKWEKLSKKFKNSYYNPDEPNRKDDDGYEWNPEFTDEPYDGRNYDLFAILADVRNGYGFAGVNTGEGFIPISQPKGLPEDVTDEVKKSSEEWGCDGHSHSFFTLKELKDYDWNKLTIKRGVISIEQFKSLIKTGGSPNSWCGATSGQNIVTVDESIAEKILNGQNNIYDGKDVYVSYRWSSLYSDTCRSFIENTIPTLEKLGSEEDIRIVFWFDN